MERLERIFICLSVPGIPLIRKISSPSSDAPILKSLYNSKLSTRWEWHWILTAAGMEAIWHGKDST